MSNRIYQAIVDAIPDMIIRISREGIFQSFEGATAELYWPADAYLGKHLRDVLPLQEAALAIRPSDGYVLAVSRPTPPLFFSKKSPKPFKPARCNTLSTA